MKPLDGMILNVHRTSLRGIVDCRLSVVGVRWREMNRKVDLMAAAELKKSIYEHNTNTHIIIMHRVF